MSNPITPLTPTQTTKQESQAAKEGYFVRLLVSLDMLGATLFGAKNDQTISSDAAIAAVKDKGFKRTYGRIMSAFLDLFQKNHGAKAVAGDEERALAEVKEEKESKLIS